MVCEPNVHAHAAHTPPAMQNQTCVLAIYLRSQVRHCYVTGKTARTKCASNDVYDLLVLCVFFWSSLFSQNAIVQGKPYTLQTILSSLAGLTFFQVTSRVSLNNEKKERRKNIQHDWPC